MDKVTKKEIGLRLRHKREQAGYTRERLAELCDLSPRFIANIEFGDATFSLDSLITMCRVLCCRSDELLFGDSRNPDAWEITLDRIRNLDKNYQKTVSGVIRNMIDAVMIAERKGRYGDHDER